MTKFQIETSEEKFCPIHPKEPLQLFCDPCEVLTCRDCQLQQHKNHRYDYVKEAAARERKILVQGMCDKFQFIRFLYRK